MKRFPKILLATLLAGLFSVATTKVMKSATPPQAQSDNSDFRAAASKDWPMANGDLGNTHYSTLTQINTQNVKDLGAAWISDKFDNNGVSRVTPVVHDGVMFITAGTEVLALDGATGKTIWKYETTGNKTPLGGRGVPNGSPSRQGAAVADGKIFVALTSAHYIALDEKTGKLLWDQPVCQECTPAMHPGITSSPVYAKGVLYGAVTFGEARFCGRLIAIDANDGHLLWRFDTIPGPGQPGHETWDTTTDVYKMGGADSWQPPVIDLENGLAFYGTGNPSPNRQAGWVRPGNNLYASTALAIDIKTGKLRWYFQTIHHDMWEGDLGTPNVGYDMDINGQMRHVVAVYRPDGTLFLFDRATGKPVWPLEERKVRPSEMLKASPTQPYPVGRGSLTERPCSDLSAPEGFILRCESGLFQPPSDDPPNALSYYPGVRNVSMSFDPQTQYMYIQGSDELTWNWSSKTPPTWELGITDFLRSRVPYIEKQDVMIYEAIDLKNYKVAWKHVYPMPMSIYGAGGFLSTAGGVTFHRLEDGNMISWDAKTGDELWKFQTGVPDNNSIQTATPMTYEAGGQQYVSIVLNDHVWGFRLGGTLPQRPAPRIPVRGTEALLGPVQDATVIRASVPNDFNYREQLAPLKARVKAGTEVTFQNNSSEVHEYMAMDGSWTTGVLWPRQVAILTFDKPGTILYHDKNHPWSYGEIIVTDASTATEGNAAPNRGGQAADEAGDAAPAAGAQGGGRGGNFAGQAVRGKAAYDQQCSTCHQAELMGNDFIPPLAGSSFTSKWQGKSAKELFDRIQMTMPPTNPGSLSPQMYLDLVAYLLQVNDVHPRGELNADNATKVQFH